MTKRDTTPGGDTPTKDLVVKTQWSGVPDVERTKECYRCQYVFRGPSEVRIKHCPRCAYDTETIEIGESGVSEEDRRSWIAACDLGLMYFNWARGYIRLMSESCEADYSSLDDFMVDVMEQSFPYLHRLVQEKILTKDGLAYVRSCANEATILLLTACIEWEERQRIEGTWGDKDDEYKEYWLKKQIAVNKALTASSVERAKLTSGGECGEEG
jgi:hypothetical protein